MSNVSALKKLKVTELREELTKRGLDSKGVKDELVQRLADAMEVQGTDTGALEPLPDLDTAGDLSAPEKVRFTSPQPFNLDKIDRLHAYACMQVPQKPIDTIEPPAPSEATPPKVSHKLSEEDKVKLRAERFGQISGKESIAGGLGKISHEEEFEKRKKRAERFGLPIPVSAVEEENKKKARAGRFGLQVPLTQAEEDAKKKARTERFAGVKPNVPKSEEFMKKLEERAKRFAA